MSSSLPSGWSTEPVLTLGRKSRVGGKTFYVGRKSQIRGVQLPHSDDWATLVVNELGDVRLFGDMPGAYPTDLPLRFVRDDSSRRLGYSSTGMPELFRYAAALPRPDGNVWDLLIRDPRKESIDISRKRDDDDSLNFDFMTPLVDIHGVPDVIDWQRDGAYDLLLGKPDGTLYRYACDRNGEQIGFAETGEPVMAMDAPIELPGPIFPCVVDWHQRGRSDLLVGSGDGYVFLYEDIGDGSQVRYARGRRLSNAKGYLKFKDGACPTVIHQGKKRYLLVADGEGAVWSYPIQLTQSYVTSDLRAAFGGESSGIVTRYEKGKWRIDQHDGRDVLVSAPQHETPEPIDSLSNANKKSNKPVAYDPPAPELSLTPPVLGIPGAGAYEIHITLLTSPKVKKNSSLEVRLSDETYHTVLVGKEFHDLPSQEVFFKAADLADREICFQQMVGSLWMTGGLPVFIEKIRLVPLKSVPAARPRKKRIPVAGISDAVDWTMWIKTDTPERVEDFVAKHKAAGMDILYHKLGGGCWEYPSRVPGARSVVPPADLEGLTTMDDQDRINTQKRIDIQESLNWVQLTADACHKLDMTCFGWMRIQNHGERLFGKGPLDEFYVNHPEYREQNLDGTYVPGKLCLAYREVRDFHIALCEEAIDLGCDGILMDTMRHLPKALHGDPVCEIFRKRYGEDMRKLPPFDTRVLEVQSEVFTSLLQEVRAAIRAKNPNATLHVRVCKPYEAYGCNPRDWAAQGIADEIIIEHRHNSDSPDIWGLVAACRGTTCDAGAVFCRTHWANEKMPLHPYRIETEVDKYLRAGANSITFYETADVFNHPEFSRAIRRINDAGELPSVMC